MNYQYQYYYYNILYYNIFYIFYCLVLCLSFLHMFLHWQHEETGTLSHSWRRNCVWFWLDKWLHQIISLFCWSTNVIRLETWYSPTASFSKAVTAGFRPEVSYCPYRWLSCLQKAGPVCRWFTMCFWAFLSVHFMWKSDLLCFVCIISLTTRRT